MLFRSDCNGLHLAIHDFNQAVHSGFLELLNFLNKLREARIGVIFLVRTDYARHEEHTVNFVLGFLEIFALPFSVSLKYFS